MLSEMQTRAELYELIKLHDFEALDASIIETILPALDRVDPERVAGVMKVCIYGAGAVGGNIAANLVAAGHVEVYVVARGATLDAIRRRGIVLRSPDRDLVAHPVLSTARSRVPSAARFRDRRDEGVATGRGGEPRPC